MLYLFTITMINESVAYSTFDGNPIQSSFIRVAHKGSRCLGERKKTEIRPWRKIPLGNECCQKCF